jgi:hypothetical protein
VEKVKISKEQIKNKGQSTTAKALIHFMIKNFPSDVKLTIFRQENPTNIRVPGQLNTYLGHKLLGTYDNENKIFEAFSIEEEDISEIMTHQNEVQWQSPFE